MARGQPKRKLPVYASLGAPNSVAANAFRLLLARANPEAFFLVTFEELQGETRWSRLDEIVAGQAGDVELVKRVSFRDGLDAQHYQLVMKDAAGNLTYTLDATLANAQPLPADGAPPVITNVAAGNLTSSYGSTRQVNDWLRTDDHPMLLAHLTPNTLYHYRVCSEDAFTNAACSGDLTFTTPANEAALCGDANKDGQVTIADVVLVIQAILGIKPDPGCPADVASPTGLTLADAMRILDVVLGKVEQKDVSCCGR